MKMADGPQVVILAAGQGTRMRSSTPKVLHRLGGRPLIDHVLEVAAAVSDVEPIVVVNPEQPAVVQHIAGRAGTAVQELPLGTGDALRSVPDDARSGGVVVVLSADVPLLRTQTLRRLLDAHDLGRPAATILTVIPDNPAGMGRIIRGDLETVLSIVEERDVPDGTAAPLECNAGVYVFHGARLWPALDALSDDNAQGEYYLTDVIAEFGGDVIGLVAADADEALGINDRRNLAAAEAALRRRTLTDLMVAGVTIEDPLTTYVDTTVQLGPDTVIHPMSVLRGATRLGSGCEVGPMAQLTDVRAGHRVRIGASALEDCVLADDVVIGAYCRVRPNTVLGSGVQLGTHAEVKNSTIGAGTRISHFSCVLDSEVGRDANIGAGTVTCNYDGSEKHRTTIGDNVFVGTNSTLVAPVHLGDNAYVGAGSFVNADVPANALAVGRSRQRNVEGWAARHRPLPE
jgi:bifunctional UDP-N-acetylglucosamine pyrophosphorylase / glucosamine-1-phosphate N-acetyltransferase